MQATSIASIIHNSGQCCVKESDDDVFIKGIYMEMLSEGLHLKIESENE
jgi:hypothetical protein